MVKIKRLTQEISSSASHLRSPANAWIQWQKYVNSQSQAVLQPNDVAKFNVLFRTHPVSRTHMLVKQGHILCTLSQDTLCGRSEHVLHDLQRRSSLMIPVFLGCHTVQGNRNSHIRKLLHLIYIKQNGYDVILIHSKLLLVQVLNAVCYCHSYI